MAILNYSPSKYQYVVLILKNRRAGSLISKQGTGVPVNFKVSSHMLWNFQTTLSSSGLPRWIFHQISIDQKICLPHPVLRWFTKISIFQVCQKDVALAKKLKQTWITIISTNYLQLVDIFSAEAKSLMEFLWNRVFSTRTSCCTKTGSRPNERWLKNSGVEKGKVSFHKE